MLASPASAQPGSSTAQGTATASVVEPLTVLAQSPLDFGTIAVAAGGEGTVIVGPASVAAQYSGAARSACAATGHCFPSPARFLVRGEALRSYRIELPAFASARGDRPGSPSLAITDLISVSAGSPASTDSGALDSEGRDQFLVGGTLSIPAGTPPDRYTAEIAVTVTYN